MHEVKKVFVNVGGHNGPVKAAWTVVGGHNTQWWPPIAAGSSGGGAITKDTSSRTYHRATASVSIRSGVAHWVIPSGRHVTKQRLTYGRLGHTASAAVSASARTRRVASGTTVAVLYYTYY